MDVVQHGEKINPNIAQSIFLSFVFLSDLLFFFWKTFKALF